MRKLLLQLRQSGRLGRSLSSWATSVEAEGVAAYAGGASERDCPYRDDQRSAEWTCGFRRAGSLDASVW